MLSLNNILKRNSFNKASVMINTKTNSICYFIFIVTVLPQKQSVNNFT